MVGRLSIDRHKVYLSYEKLHLTLQYSQLIVDLIDEEVQDDFVGDVDTVDFDLNELAVVISYDYHFDSLDGVFV